MRSLATKLAEYFSPQALTKTQTLTQISDLKHGLVDWFVSAKSRFRDIAQSIGLINDHITHRIDFSVPTFLDTFNPFLFHPEQGTASLEDGLDQIRDLDHQHNFSEADYASVRTVHARILMRLRHTSNLPFSQILLGAFPPGVSTRMHPEGKHGLQIYLLAMAHHQSVQLHEDALALAQKLNTYLA